MGARVGGLEGLRCASLEPVLSWDVCVWPWELVESLIH